MDHTEMTVFSTGNVTNENLGITVVEGFATSTPLNPPRAASRVFGKWVKPTSSCSMNLVMD